jgi:hypothetical protein
MPRLARRPARPIPLSVARPVNVLRPAKRRNLLKGSAKQVSPLYQRNVSARKSAE